MEKRSSTDKDSNLQKINIKKSAKQPKKVPRTKKTVDRNAFLEEFRKVITSEPRRTGKPTLMSPEEMKRIWEETI